VACCFEELSSVAGTSVDCWGSDGTSVWATTVGGVSKLIVVASSWRWE
jgi:hypothetical protein